MTEPLVYLNGRMVAASEAHLPIFDSGIVMGATVTEMTRTFRKKLFRLDEHLDRLFRSLHYARLDVGLSKAELTGLCAELVARNSALGNGADELGLVIFVTAGEYPTYAVIAGRPARIGPTVCVHTFPLPFELWAKKMQMGAHLVTPSIRQVPAQCYDPQMKCRSRMHYYLADKEAQLVDPEGSALLLDLAGNVTETATANFLIVEGGGIVTPPSASILPGISWAVVRELAGELGIPFAERDFQVFNAVNAEEAFVTSTPYCIMPVTKINGIAIGDGKPGPMFHRVIAAWGQKVEIDIVRQILDGGRRRQAP